jgi:hypothetical protein
VAQIQSQAGAREQMGRNGGAQEMWHLTTSTVSATCIEGVPVQESLWKFIPTMKTSTTTITSSRGLAVKIIKLFLLLLPLLPWLFQTKQSTPLVFHLSFLDLLLLSNTTSLLWHPLHHTRNPGGYFSFSIFHFMTHGLLGGKVGEKEEIEKNLRFW